MGQTSGTAGRDENLRFDHRHVSATGMGEASLVELRVGGELCADQKQLTVKKTKL